MVADLYVGSMTTLPSYGCERHCVCFNVYASVCAESACVKQIVWRYQCVCRPSLPTFISLLASNPVRTLREHWEEYQPLSNINPRATCSLHCPITGVSAIVYASMCMCLYVWILPVWFKVYGDINRSVVQVFRLLSPCWPQTCKYQPLSIPDPQATCSLIKKPQGKKSASHVDYSSRTETDNVPGCCRERVRASC